MIKFLEELERISVEEHEQFVCSTIGVEVYGESQSFFGISIETRA